MGLLVVHMIWPPLHFSPQGWNIHYRGSSGITHFPYTSGLDGWKKDGRSDTLPISPRNGRCSMRVTNCEVIRINYSLPRLLNIHEISPVQGVSVAILVVQQLDLMQGRGATLTVVAVNTTGRVLERGMSATNWSKYYGRAGTCHPTNLHNRLDFATPLHSTQWLTHG